MSALSRSAAACNAVRPDVILLAYPVLGPLHRDSPFAGERIDPAAVLVGPFPQDILCDGSGLVQSRFDKTRLHHSLPEPVAVERGFNK